MITQYIFCNIHPSLDVYFKVLTWHICFFHILLNLCCVNLLCPNNGLRRHRECAPVVWHHKGPQNKNNTMPKRSDLKRMAIVSLNKSVLCIMMFIRAFSDSSSQAWGWLEKFKLLGSGGFSGEWSGIRGVIALLKFSKHCDRKYICLG